MGIAEVAQLPVDPADDLPGTGIVAAGRPEFSLDFLQQGGGDGVDALGVQLVHQPCGHLQFPQQKGRQASFPCCHPFQFHISPP